MARTITRAFEAAKDNAHPNSATHQLATRITIAKDLPIFDGDPLEWSRLKKNL